MWMSDVHSIGGYTFAAGLFFLGLAAWQVGVAMMVGIFIVYGFMLDLLPHAVGRAGDDHAPRDGDGPQVPGPGGVSLNLSNKGMSTGDWILRFTTVVALVVAYFSALLLNYCDFSRFAPEEDTVKKGTLLGLPLNFAVFALVTVLVTAGSIAVFGEAIRDPVEIVARIDNTAVVIVGAIIFTVATVGINLVANYVSPAYDLANVAPKYIDFRRGGLITSVLAVVVLPWHIYGSAWAVNYFLGGLGAILGPLFAIMMVDFYRVRRRKVDVDDLYVDGPEGSYWYQGGWNLKAIQAFVPAALVSVPCALLTSLHDAAAFSWFIGAGVAAVVYALIARRPAPERAPVPATAAAGA